MFHSSYLQFRSRFGFRVQYENITTRKQLDTFCDRISAATTIAFDTEFVSEDAYRPELCLVQVAAAGELAFPMGFVSFGLAGLTPGGMATATLQLDGAQDFNDYYKFGPTTVGGPSVLHPFSFDGQTGAEIFSDRIVLHFVDGGRGDADGTANGAIFDPGGPVINSTDAPWRNAVSPYDVNNDGKVSPLDVLLLIRELRDNGSHALELPAPAGHLFLDPTGDNQITPRDALVVIADLSNAGTTGEGEPENPFPSANFASHLEEPRPSRDDRFHFEDFDEESLFEDLFDTCCLSGIASTGK